MHAGVVSSLMALTALVAGVEARVETGSQDFGRSTKVEFKISVPDNVADTSSMGLNVLLHGDGGSSFDAFPNQINGDNLMGVVIQAPNKERTWGQARSDAERDNGEPEKNFSQGDEHSDFIHDMLKPEGAIGKKYKFDRSKIFFTGVSGGSLLLTGFFLPKYASEYNTGALLICGGMVTNNNRNYQGGVDTLKKLRIHYQSSKQELTAFKRTIPASIDQMVGFLRGGSVSDDDINRKFTFNSDPNSGHCAIDGSSNFDNGVQFAVNNFGAFLGLNGNTPALTPHGITTKNTNPLY